MSHAQATSSLRLPAGIAFDAAGNLYVADTNRNQVLEATLAGTLIVVAGTGTQGFAGDTGPATSAELNAPQGITIGPDGTIYIADTGNHRIRTVVAGQITTFAGTGTTGYSGDGAAPTTATLRSPTALALDPTGALLLCDTGNHRVRLIANGIITTVAGNGTQGFTGDNDPATAAELDTPLGVVAFGAGAFYIADTHNDRIRAVGLDGTIHTIAGTGVRGFSGDGGPATQAKLALPRSIVLTSTGVVVSDSNNQRLRLIDSSGIIHTLAGNGTEGKTADGDATLSATMDTPTAIAISPFGFLTFSDSANRMLRMIANSQLFAPAALAPARTSQISTTQAPTEIYGNAVLNLGVDGSTGTPQGTVQLLDGSTVLATSTLANATATLPLPTLGAGQHHLIATYLGDGLNPAATAAVTLDVSPAPSITTEPLPTQSTYAGLPITLTAQVVSTTSGLPSGAVQFFEGTNLIATGQLVSGSASGVYLGPAAGTHSIKAVYGGDSNFLSSNASPMSVVVQAIPDFALSSTAPSQAVQGGSIATYPITITSQPGVFSGIVSMSTSGLPIGATVSFNPSQVVPGSGGTTLQMSITTPTTVVKHTPTWPNDHPTQATLLLFAVSVMALRKRRRDARFILCICLSLVLLPALGCASRSIATPTATTSYVITVTGTSTNLAGAVVVHTTVVQLNVR